MGNLQFSGFSAFSLEPNASLIAPSSIMVSPISGGLDFNFGAVANSGQLLDSVYGFNVSPVTGPGLLNGITGDSLTLVEPSATLDGGVAGVEVSCLGVLDASGACSGAMAGRNLAAYSLSSTSQLTDSISFGPSPLLGVKLDISADGGRSGAATLSAVSAQFTESPIATPEPGTLPLLAGALIGLAGISIWNRKTLKWLRLMLRFY